MTAASACLAVQAQTKTWLDVPYVEVMGKAEMEVDPNEIYVNITISEQNNKTKKSVEQLEREMKSALKGMGIDIEKDLRVKDMSSALKKYWYKSDQIYTAKEYQLLVRSAGDLGRAFQTLEAVGIADIRIGRVSHKDILKLRSEVKINAAKDARQKASDLVQAVGHKLGKCLHLQEIDYISPRPYRAAPAAAKAMSFNLDEAQEPELEFEKIKIEYSVTAKFVIE